MIKAILAVIFLFCCGSIGNAAKIDEGDTWVSNRYTGTVPDTGYRQGDRIKHLNINKRVYEFKKSGHNLYKAYDDETGNLLEMKSKGRSGYGEWEVYDHETGENWLIKEPAKRE
ncbi:MAG: hypothetical protein OS130_01475 [Thermodesulfobacteriota bacterium]|nr:MAG: hypothetical protein OS130_01475 [Thermodesulfobacteriota bacterium]